MQNAPALAGPRLASIQFSRNARGEIAHALQ
jgi:hypothetical protein